MHKFCQQNSQKLSILFVTLLLLFTFSETKKKSYKESATKKQAVHEFVTFVDSHNFPAS